jgi:O-antigen/teichoic acid export membrane protein
MGSQYIVFAMQFAVSVIISRFFLSPAEVGLFSTAFAAAMLVSVLQDFGLTRYISGLRELNETHVRLCSSVSLTFALLIVAVIALLAWPAARFYDEPRMFAIMLIIAASFLFVPFSIVSTALLMRSMDFRSVAYINISGAITGGAVAIGSAAAGFSAESLAWGLVGQNIARALLAQWRRPALPPLPLRFEGARPVVDFGMATSALYVMGGLGTRSPDLVIGHLISMHAVGLFSRATGLALQLRTLVAGAIGGVLYPAFARIHNRGEPLGPAYLRVLAGYTAVIWPAMALLAVAAEPVVLILFGETWARVAPLLFWIAIAEMIFTALPLHFELPILLGRKRLLAKLTLVDNVSSLVFLILAAQVSLEWAAMSRVAYGLFWVVLYAPFLYRLVQFDVAKLLTTYVKSAVVTLAAVCPLLLSDRFWLPLGEMGFAQLALLSGLGVGLWLLSLFAVRHGAVDEIVGLVETLWAQRRRPFASGAK